MNKTENCEEIHIEMWKPPQEEEVFFTISLGKENLNDEEKIHGKDED